MSKMSSTTTTNTSIFVSGANFSPENDILYTKPKINSSGGKSIGILNAHTKKGFYINTPLMLTWGMNENDFDGTGKKSYDMALQFPNDEYHTDNTRAFLKNMVELEAKFKADAIKYSKEWMNKPKLSADVVDALWSPMLKYPKNKDTGEFDYDRSPTLKIKIPFWEGDFKTEIFDIEKRQLFPNEDGPSIMELIPKGVNVATVIQCGGVWLANGKFGVTWKLFQCVVKPKPSMRGTCHIDISDEDKQKMTVLSDEFDPEESNEKTVEIVDDSDVEDEVAPVSKVEVVVPEVVPEVVAEVVAEVKQEQEPATKKKIVKKVAK